MEVKDMSQPSLLEPKRGRDDDLEQRNRSGQDTAPEDRTECIPENKRGNRQLGQCVPKASISLEINIKWEGLDAHIQDMKDHALIAEFVRIWSSERSLVT